MKMTGFAAATLLAGAAFAFPATSQAQVDNYRTGYDKGFEDGMKRSEKARSKGDEYDLIHDSKYRKGDAGYKKSYGPRQDYIAGYRDGYEQAYRRGYRAGDARGRDDPYGYGRDGRYGRDDRERRERNDDYDDDVVYEER